MRVQLSFTINNKSYENYKVLQNKIIDYWFNTFFYNGSTVNQSRYFYKSQYFE